MDGDGASINNNCIGRFVHVWFSVDTYFANISVLVHTAGPNVINSREKSHPSKGKQFPSFLQKKTLGNY